MKVIGIESTAHTIGIGIAERTSRGPAFLSNEKRVFRAVGKGFVPAELADHHARHFREVLERALSAADTAIDEIDALAYSKGPGIGTCLRIASTAAGIFSKLSGKPVVGVNHSMAHVEIAKFFAKSRDPLVLYASGGNTQLIMRAGRRYLVIGETLDMGIGNLFDSFARSLNLEYPTGSELERLAAGGKYLQMPYSLKGMNFTFSGLQTNAERLIGKHPEGDIAYSLMETSFAMLCEGVEKALTFTGKKELVACGGVTCNARLREMLSILARERGVSFGCAPNEFNVDNGAMIAYVGLKLLEKNYRPGPGLPGIDQDYRIDKVVLPKGF